MKGLWIQFHIPLITLNYRPGLSRPGPVSIEWKPRPILRGAKGIFQKRKADKIKGVRRNFYTIK